MLGYLMRGDAYRRRDELEAALRDLRQAAESTPAHPGRASCSATSTTPAHRFPPAAEHYQAYVDLDDRSPRVLYKLALARYRAGSRRSASRRCRRRSRSTRVRRGLLPAGAVPARRAADRDGAGVAREGDRARADAAAGARGAGRSVRPPRPPRGVDRRSSKRCARSIPGPARDVTLGLAYSQAGQSDRARHHASARRRALSDVSAHLRRARPGLAGNRAGPVRSRRPEQGPRGAREGGRRRGQRARRYMLFGRALLLASDAEPRRAHAPAGDGQAAGRSAGVLLPRRRGGARAATPTSRARRCSTTSRSPARIPTAAAELRSPCASAISRCASRTFLSPRPGTSAQLRRCRHDQGVHRQAQRSSLARRSERTRAKAMLDRLIEKDPGECGCAQTLCGGCERAIGSWPTASPASDRRDRASRRRGN